MSAGRWVLGSLVTILAVGTLGAVLVLGAVALQLDTWADRSANQPAAAASPTVSPSPTGACPATDDDTPAGCLPYDPEALMRSNDAYRQRSSTPEDAALAARSVPAVEAALAALTGSGATFRSQDVVDALTAAGFATVQTTGDTDVWGDGTTAFGIGVSVPGGCVFGDVRPGVLALESGGPIADGGCLEMPSH
ncbi:DUF6993 domain-containing protein [Oerskovia enterophila]|uniref:DUF6993 domain-containing protein n=1 Tax=Oerskovia enterophila TaxID=43678 RepID=UPI001111B597|nr:hypothetical protein [Oerskovia enterophila]